MNMPERVVAFVGMRATVKINGEWYVGNLNRGGTVTPWDGVTLHLIETGDMRRAFPNLAQGFPRLFSVYDVEEIQSPSD